MDKNHRKDFLRDKCSDGATDLGPTDRTLPDGGGTHHTAAKVSTGQEHHPHFSVQTDLTRLLLT